MVKRADQLYPHYHLRTQGRARGRYRRKLYCGSGGIGIPEVLCEVSTGLADGGKFLIGSFTGGHGRCQKFSGWEKKGSGATIVSKPEFRVFETSGPQVGKCLLMPPHLLGSGIGCLKQEMTGAWDCCKTEFLLTGKEHYPGSACMDYIKRFTEPPRKKTTPWPCWR